MQGASLLARRLSHDAKGKSLSADLKNMQSKDAALREEAGRVMEEGALLPVYVTSLVDSYRPSIFYFEVFESTRKLLLTGVLIFYRQGSLEQVPHKVLYALGGNRRITPCLGIQLDDDHMLPCMCALGS